MRQPANNCLCIPSVDGSTDMTHSANRAFYDGVAIGVRVGFRTSLRSVATRQKESSRDATVLRCGYDLQAPGEAGASWFGADHDVDVAVEQLRCQCIRYSGHSRGRERHPSPGSGWARPDGRRSGVPSAARRVFLDFCLRFLHFPAPCLGLVSETTIECLPGVCVQERI